MLNAIGDSLSDLASFNDGEAGEDMDGDDKDAELLNFSEDEAPSRVMGTMSIIVHHLMVRFRQKQMKLDTLTQPGWGDATDYCGDRDTKYETTKLEVLAVVQPYTKDDPASSRPTTVGKPMQTAGGITRDL